MSTCCLFSFACSDSLVLPSILWFPFVLLIPKSDSDRWWSYLTHQVPLRSSILHSLSFPVCCQMNSVPKGAPCEFPASVSDPILLVLYSVIFFFFFMHLQLSEGQEFTFRAVNVEQGHPHSHTQTTFSPRLAGRLG